ncbi:MAG: glycine--tRNA ligase [Nanoarchaeota archaeon]
MKTKTLAYLGKIRKEAEKKAKEVLEKKQMKILDLVAGKTEGLEQTKISIDELATFCKRKGFVYPSSEIYGGLSGFYDYGHLGTLLKKNFENIWRKYFLSLSNNFFEIETSEIMPENVFVASGHLKNFADIAAKCKKGHIERADHLLERHLNKKFEGLNADELFDLIKENKIVCSVCKNSIEYVGLINMMFPVQIGVGSTTIAYLRPETAQGPYVNFKLQYELARNKLPLGLALIGKAYRNELSPKNILLRQRAFTQAELQIFFNPKKINEHENFNAIENFVLNVVLSDEREKGVQKIKCGELVKKVPQFYVYYMAKVQQFYLEILKFPEEKFRFFELNEREKAFYNKYHFDIEAELNELGWVEIGGVHYRTDHDLKGHQEVSKQNLSVLDEETRERFIPHVLELSFGVDRNFQTLLTFAYHYDKGRGNVILKLNPKLSPIKAAIFPIVKKPEFEKISEEVFNELKKEFNVAYDESGSIGRRYARNDESGTPFCITIDGDSTKNNDVTIRERDSGEQTRIKIKNLKECLRKAIDGENILKFGKIINTRKK